MRRRPETWCFAKDGKSATVRSSGPLRVNNGDAMLPALVAGTGLGTFDPLSRRPTEALEGSQSESVAVLSDRIAELPG